MHNRKTLSIWFFALSYLALLYLGLHLTILFKYGHGLPTDKYQIHIKAFTIIYLIWLAVFFSYGLFELSSFRRYSSIVFKLVSAMAVNLAIAIIYFYLQPNLILTPRRFLLLDAALVFVFLLAWNLLLKYVLKNRFAESVYFLGNENFSELENEIATHNFLGFKVKGYLDEAAIATNGLNFENGENFSVILSDSFRSNARIISNFYELRKRGLNIYNHKDFYESLTRRVYISHINELWFLENVNYKDKLMYNLLKRVTDLFFGIIAGIVFLVLFPVVALLIRLTSPGPVFFVQERIGRNGKIFKVYKYRTMKGGITDSWTAENDPRITMVGKFLRKSRIDELPQSINLILGNMSLVGPRPEQVHIVAQLKEQIPFYDERHLVKPGITGWAQLNVYASSVEESKLKLQYDLYYIKHRSLLFDGEIILKTLYYILTFSGR